MAVDEAKARKLFKQYGWQYDKAKDRWVAISGEVIPSAALLTLEELDLEQQLISAVRRNSWPRRV